VAERTGQFQLARGGTLFLDEIGDMPLVLQAKLLRALQGGEVQPVGGRPVRVDARVVTATNSDLDQKIQQGLFRRDLYYRVAGVSLRVPSLRERREDIPELVHAFLDAFAREAGKPRPRITAEALRVLTGYAWPGNVRELEHEARRLVHTCGEGETIDLDMLSPRVVVSPEPETPAPPCSLRLDANIEDLERRLIQATLARTRGNRSTAARVLGISRNGLAMKMDRLGLGLRTVTVAMKESRDRA
jgi:DNA-binding NtrC family response regulator